VNEDQFQLESQPVKSRAERIRELFTGSSTAELAHICLDAGLWSDTDLKRFQFRAARNECRAAIKERDASGLPYAGQTTARDDEGATIWQPRLLWTYDDYAINVAELVEQREECHETAVKLSRECGQRYGRAPSLSAPSLDYDAADD